MSEKFAKLLENEKPEISGLLYFNHRGISDISAFKDYKEAKLVKKLILSGNHFDFYSQKPEEKVLRKISGIEVLTNLKELELKNNRINDITEIGELKKLTSLDLSNNILNTFTKSKEEKKLTIDILKSLKKLTSLDINNNFFSFEEVKEIAKALPFCNITWSQQSAWKHRGPLVDKIKELGHDNFYKIKDPKVLKGLTDKDHTFITILNLSDLNQFQKYLLYKNVIKKEPRIIQELKLDFKDFKKDWELKDLSKKLIREEEKQILKIQEIERDKIMKKVKSLSKPLVNKQRND